MTFDTDEFLTRANLDSTTLEIWIEEGWLIPARAESGAEYREADVARVRLIRDLLDDLGVNAEGVGVILNLIDQVHGLRGALMEYVARGRAQA